MSRWRADSPRHSASAYAPTVVALFGLLPLIAADPRFRSRRGRTEVVRVIVGIVPSAVGGRGPDTDDDRSLVVRISRTSRRSVRDERAGSLLGPLLPGFWLLPAMGERSALLVLSLPCSSWGSSRRSTRRRDGPQRRGHRGSPAPRGCFRRRRGGSVLVTVASRAGRGLVAAVRRARRDHTRDRDRGERARTASSGDQWRTHAYSTTVTKIHGPSTARVLERPPDHALVVAFGMGTTFGRFSRGISTRPPSSSSERPGPLRQFHRNAVQLSRLSARTWSSTTAGRFLDASTTCTT